MRVAVQWLRTEMDAGSLTSTVPEFDSDRTSMNLIFDAVCETKPVFAMLWQAFNFVFCLCAYVLHRFLPSETLQHLLTRRYFICDSDSAKAVGQRRTVGHFESTY